MTEYYEEKDVDGVKHSELKPDAPVEVAYAFWSRKPFYLVEFRGDRRAALASNLLALGDKTKFKEASVSISLAQGTSVTAVKEKMNLLGGVPKHNDNTADEASRASKPAAPVKVADERPVAKPSLPPRPSATTFVPRALWKR
ncbi:Hypothetical protein, putative [Bodo saltans]|uniref:Uncharacterized protein n=1 Tax=Bodo saltans TaxID=75058 RepID=A0A0S4IXD7_BODSA|nr:Hypothetical protein, putative [Bodo saltans]|eukprot:CUG06409.1 Hypothetical protein, putative [Bodo saltans]